MSVAALAADLSGVCSASQITSIVSSARRAGLSDEQIANAFGRAATVTSCCDVLAQGYANFSSETLGAAYNAGINTANQSSVGGSGGSGDNGGFNPPSGGSGGGGGSSNE